MANFNGYAAGLATVAFASLCFAGPKGPDGLEIEPKCDTKEFTEKLFKDAENQIDVGLLGSSEKFRSIKILAAADESYTVVGEKKSDTSNKNYCTLLKKSLGFPDDLQQEPFYKLYFANFPANQALMKKFMGAK